jgi:hypothetical protein
MRDLILPGEPDTFCHNRRHPDGPYHAAAPLPASWQTLAVIEHQARFRAWGCGCPAWGHLPRLSWWERARRWWVLR